MSSELYLDTLVPKQRAKEFKAVGKAVKNKDDAIKQDALKKLAEDPRYVTEGGCIMPLLEIMVPKKKTLEFTETAVDAFITFLRPAPKEIAEGEEEAPAPSAESLWTPSIEGLETIKTLTSNLDSLKVLSELLVYKDNVKLPKPPKVKKGETPPPPPPPPADSQLSINLRRNSLKGIFYIAEALMNATEKEELKSMFSEIEHLTPNLCETIIRLAKLLMPPPAKEAAPAVEGEEANEGGEEEAAAAEEAAAEPELSEEEIAAKEAALAAAAEECEWALITLALLVGTSPKSCKTVLGSEAAALLPALMQLKPAFTLPLLQILLALAKQDSEDIPGLVYVTAPSVFTVLVEAGASTSQALCAEEAGESGVCEADDPLRLSLSHLNVIVALMSHVAAMQRSFPSRISPLDLAGLAVLVPAINGALLSQKVWEISRSPGPSGDSSMAGFVSRCCALLGTIAEASQSLRRALSCYPTASSLISLLKAGREVVGEVQVYAVADEDSDETRAAKEEANVASRKVAVSTLRRSAEKALLTILSVDEADVGTPGTRWSSCGAHKTDLVLFEAPAAEADAEAEAEAEAPAEGEGEEPADAAAAAAVDAPKVVAFPGAELVALLDAVGEDDELADRATRLLAALALGSPDSTTFAGDSLQVGPEALSKLGAVLLARADTVVEKNAAGISAAADGEEATAGLDEAAEEEKGADVGDGDGDGDGKKPEAEAEAEAATPTFSPAAPGPSDLSTPSAQEVLYLGLSLVEACVAAGADQVIAFATEEIVTAVSQAVFTSGPTSVAAAAPEIEVTLYDVRDMQWAPRTDAPDAPGLCSKAYLRPLCLDVLSLVLLSDPKGRVYEPMEGEEESPSFPLAAGAEVPASSSPTEECALRVCRLAADGIVSTLTTEVSYSDNGSASVEVYADPSNTDTGVLVSSVLKAALRAAAAIGSCGKAGLEIALKALADAGFPAEEAEEGALFATGAMKSLVGYLETVTAPAAKKTERAPVPEGEEGVEEQKGEEEEAEPEAPLTVASALADYAWALPEAFVDVIKEGLPTSARNILQQPVLWPFVAFLGPATAVLRNPVFDSETAQLALQVLAGASSGEVYAQGTQPVCHDVFCACAVSTGGAVALAGASGAFGHLANGDGSPEGTEVGMRLVSRGYHSEEFWRQQHAPPAVEEGEETEPAETEAPPPHTGPSEALWGAMLRLPVDDLHLKCPSSSSLTSALQSASPGLGVELIARGADINAKDGFGRSALMYALVMRDGESFRALMAASPNLELTDSQGSPVAKYALISLPETEVRALTRGKQRADRACLSSGPFAADVFSAGADVNTADTDGNSMLQLAVGLAAVDVTIGGVNLKISSAAYVDEEICAKEATHSLCDQLLSAGAKVNTCNKDGITALHVVAARGHTELIKLFLHYHVAPCIKDKAGMLPIHYVAACCPQNFQDTLVLMMKISDNRPLLHGSFDDERLKKGKAERLAYDIDVAFEEVFTESVVPSSISERRLSREDLLVHLTSDQRSLFQLVLAGHVLADGYYTPFVSTSADTKAERMQAAIYLCTEFLTKEMGVDATDSGALSAKVSSVVGSVSDTSGFTSMHAAALLLRGVTERVPLTPAQKRSKRVRSYESAELHVLDLVSSQDANATTTQAVKGAAGWSVAEGAAWTALHASIWAGNPSLVRTLVEQCDLSNPAFAGLTDCLVPAGAASEDMIRVVISGVSDTASWATHLTPSLLGAAVESRNPALIAALVSEPKVNPNAPIGEGASQRTALHTAVEVAAAAGADADSMMVLEAFATNADRLDMCVEDAFGNTCVDAAVASRSQPLVALLLSMRRNDVIERILTSRNGGPSLLFELEEENMQKAKDAGYYVGEEPAAPADGVALEPSAEPESEAAAAAAGDEVAVAEASADAEEGAPEGEEGAGAGGAEIEVIDSLETNVASFNPTTEEDLKALEQSNALVKGLVDAVSGLVSEDCHCHKCYSEGMTYSEYVQSRM